MNLPRRFRRYTARHRAPGSGGWSTNMIRLSFPDPADSPTQRSPLRVRYSLEAKPNGWKVPVLHFAHGTHKLTADAWAGFRAAGASIDVTSDRELQVVREVLGTRAGIRLVEAAPVDDDQGALDLPK